MATIKQLIDALRCEVDCSDCAYYDTTRGCDKWGMRCDAADALEAAEHQLVDAVVRCKNCKHHELCKNGVNGWCNELNIPTDVTNYCFCGESKESEVLRKMKVMLIYKPNNKPVFIDNAIAFRIERDARGLDSWVIETEEGKQLFTCSKWFIYPYYDQK